MTTQSGKFTLYKRKLTQIRVTQLSLFFLSETSLQEILEYNLKSVTISNCHFLQIPAKDKNRRKRKRKTNTASYDFEMDPFRQNSYGQIRRRRIDFSSIDGLRSRREKIISDLSRSPIIHRLSHDRPSRSRFSATRWELFVLRLIFIFIHVKRALSGSFARARAHTRRALICMPPQVAQS